MSDTISNETMAEYGHRAMTAYNRARGVDQKDTPETDLTDLFYDLLHWADEQGLDGARCARQAMLHHEAEQQGG